MTVKDQSQYHSDFEIISRKGAEFGLMFLLHIIRKSFWGIHLYHCEMANRYSNVRSETHDLHVVL